MAEIMNADAMNRTLVRIAHEILERNKGCEDLCLLGVKRRGVPLARKIASNIQKIEGKEVPVSSIDISPFRDDLHNASLSDLAEAKLDLDVNDKKIIIVDDVIHTGRTARAAMECVLNSGRPSFIELAVMIDRGHRELPIRPDFIGKNVPTAEDERILVMVEEIDKENAVHLLKK